jgi:hypothetical protein
MYTISVMEDNIQNVSTWDFMVQDLQPFIHELVAMNTELTVGEIKLKTKQKIPTLKKIIDCWNSLNKGGEMELPSGPEWETSRFVEEEEKDVVVTIDDIASATHDKQVHIEHDDDVDSLPSIDEEEERFSSDDEDEFDVTDDEEDIDPIKKKYQKEWNDITLKYMMELNELKKSWMYQQ